MQSSVRRHLSIPSRPLETATLVKLGLEPSAGCNRLVIEQMGKLCFEFKALYDESVTLCREKSYRLLRVIARSLL